MGASRRRRMYRLAMGENKKIMAYSAEHQCTVGVLNFTLRGDFRGAMKASKGAEKSCLRKRRRKRGLRKNVRRSRGRHPRRSELPATSSNPSSRGVNHHLRMIYWANHVGSHVWEQVNRLPDLTTLKSQGQFYGRILKIYSSRKKRIVRSSSKLLGSSVLGTDLISYLEGKGLRMFPRKLSAGFAANRDQVVDSFLSHLRAELPRRETDPVVPSRPRRNGLTRRGHVRVPPRSTFCVRCGGFRPRASTHGRECDACYNVRHGIPPPYRP